MFKVLDSIPQNCQKEEEEEKREKEGNKQTKSFRLSHSSVLAHLPSLHKALSDNQNPKTKQNKDKPNIKFYKEHKMSKGKYSPCSWKF
jgi:hypothetical protein